MINQVIIFKRLISRLRASLLLLIMGVFADNLPNITQICALISRINTAKYLRYTIILGLQQLAAKLC